MQTKILLGTWQIVASWFFANDVNDLDCIDAARRRVQIAQLGFVDSAVKRVAHCACIAKAFMTCLLCWFFPQKLIK